MGCALQSLVTDETGAVVGAVAEQGGETVRIKAGAVLLGTGGFDHNPQMMRENIPSNVYITNASAMNTGDGHRAAQRVGARLALMDTFWGLPFFYPAAPKTFDPNADTQFSATSADWNGYRGKPNSMVVNAAGKRFTDEAVAYAPFVRPYGNYSNASMTCENQVAYFICDSDYLLTAKLPGMTDDDLTPNEWFVQADTLEELAAELGIDEEGLLAEVEKFNGYAEAGYDPDFHRGEKASGVQIFSPSVDRPDLANPLIGPIATPPFYGALYLAGSCGTSGGVKINEHAQVVDVDGAVIPGLYACGNCTASISGGGYMGGGATLAPGCTMAYLAARHALGVE
jgi:3-oxosteroid 1-dehydrogenase